jgi:hypothetical protein
VHALLERQGASRKNYQTPHDAREQDALSTLLAGHHDDHTADIIAPLLAGYHRRKKNKLITHVTQTHDLSFDFAQDEEPPPR